MSSDNGPRPVQRVSKRTGQGERRYLFTEQLLKNTRLFFSDPNQHRAIERFKLRQETIMWLVVRIGSPAIRRKYVRTNTTGIRRFVVGLAQLKEDLNAETRRPLPEIPLTDPAPVAVETSQQDLDVEELEIVLEQDRRLSGDSIWVNRKPTGSGPEDNGGQASADPHSAELTGSFLNTSVGGYCMTWLNHSVAGARVGELIGLYESEQRSHFGIIRWLHYKDNFGLIFGVELLSPVVESVEIESGGEGEPVKQGLYLAANQRLGQPACLLVEPGAVKAGQVINLQTKQGRWRSRLDSLLDSTLTFQLFSLVPLQNFE